MVRHDPQSIELAYYRLPLNRNRMFENHLEVRKFRQFTQVSPSRRFDMFQAASATLSRRDASHLRVQSR